MRLLDCLSLYFYFYNNQSSHHSLGARDQTKFIGSVSGCGGLSEAILVLAT